MPVWSPQTYLQFADERGRPFHDLLARVAHGAPRTVVDLGCGPGELTATLAQRWPDARITGIDSSPQMIERARAHALPSLDFQVADLTGWQPDGLVDVLVSNAALQWVPNHRDLLGRLVGWLAPDGWFAFQVPGNFGEPSHVLLHELADDPRFRGQVGQHERPHAYAPEAYLADLTELGLVVDAWETTYLHVLRGEDPVFAWISGTGARPVLAALPMTLAAVVEEYRAALRAAYPETGTAS